MCSNWWALKGSLHLCHGEGWGGRPRPPQVSRDVATSLCRHVAGRSMAAVPNPRGKGVGDRHLTLPGKGGGGKSNKVFPIHPAHPSPESPSSPPGNALLSGPTAKTPNPGPRVPARPASASILARRLSGAAPEDSPRTFFSASSLPAGADEAGAGPGAASPPGLPASSAAGAGAWGAPPAAGLLGAGSGGAAAGASAAACGSVVPPVVASPASLMPPLRSLRAPRWRLAAVSAVEVAAAGSLSGRPVRIARRRAASGGRRRWLEGGGARARGLAGSPGPEDGPAQVLAGGGRRGADGRAGAGRGEGGESRRGCSLAFKGALGSP